MTTRVPGEGLIADRGRHRPRGSATAGPVVGVLALQGDVLENLRMLAAAGATARPVKRADELEGLDGILIPGGESTTMGKLALLYGLMEPLRACISAGMPAFGTCAGAILLASRALRFDGKPVEQPLLGIMDTVVRRNAFGRQVDSFEADLEVAGVTDEGNGGGSLHAVFIRAPWIEEHGRDVEVLAEVATPLGARVVVARQGHVLVSAFHPELTEDTRLHRYFVERLVRGAAAASPG